MSKEFKNLCELLFNFDASGFSVCADVIVIHNRNQFGIRCIECHSVFTDMDVFTEHWMRMHGPATIDTIGTKGNVEETVTMMENERQRTPEQGVAGGERNEDEYQDQDVDRKADSGIQSMMQPNVETENDDVQNVEIICKTIDLSSIPPQTPKSSRPSARNAKTHKLFPASSDRLYKSTHDHNYADMRLAASFEPLVDRFTAADELRMVISTPLPESKSKATQNDIVELRRTAAMIKKMDNDTLRLIDTLLDDDAEEEEKENEEEYVRHRRSGRGQQRKRQKSASTSPKRTETVKDHILNRIFKKNSHVVNRKVASEPPADDTSNFERLETPPQTKDSAQPDRDRVSVNPPPLGDMEILRHFGLQIILNGSIENEGMLLQEQVKDLRAKASQFASIYKSLPYLWNASFTSTRHRDDVEYFFGKLLRELDTQMGVRLDRSDVMRMNNLISIWLTRNNYRPRHVQERMSFSPIKYYMDLFAFIPKSRRSLLYCEFCAEVLNTEENYGTHRVWHTGSSLYHCYMCSQGFNRMSALEYHMKDHKEHRCNDCNAEFDTFTQWFEHQDEHNKRRRNRKRKTDANDEEQQ